MFKKTNIIPVVMGLGYVGLPIFLSLQKKFNVIGYDLNEERIKQLINKKDINNEFNKKDLDIKKGSIFTNNLIDISKGNFFIVTVPTPINSSMKPNLNSIINCSHDLSKIIKKNDIIFYESTVFPTVTEKICIPILNKSGLVEGKNFYVGYSPERINPGDKNKTLNLINKIVAFKYSRKKNIVKTVYKNLAKNLYFTNKIIEAEASKVIENIQRDLNIALVNEIYKVCYKAKINFKSVIKLAKTKWNFIDYKPGLVGGHCLPVDPYYFSSFAKKTGIKTNVILAGRKTNNDMYKFCLKQIIKKMKDIKKKKSKIKILFLGVSYKPNVADLRNSFSLKLYRSLKQKIKNVYAFDPILDNKIAKKNQVINHKVDLKKFDLIINAVNHSMFKNHLKSIKKNKLRYLELFN